MSTLVLRTTKYSTSLSYDLLYHFHTHSLAKVIFILAALIYIHAIDVNTKVNVGL